MTRCRFDWSHEIVILDDVAVAVKVTHVRLCHSRMLLVRAYPRKTAAETVLHPAKSLQTASTSKSPACTLAIHKVVDARVSG